MNLFYLNYLNYFLKKYNNNKIKITMTNLMIV